MFNLYTPKVMVFLCEEISHTKFFFNMENAFTAMGIDCIYLVLDLYVYTYMNKRVGKRAILIKKRLDKYPTKEIIYNTKEYIEQELSVQEIKILYSSAYSYCEKIGEKYSDVFFICSQGVKTGEIAVKDYAKKNGKKILFCELANLPGKTFFDIEGSNAASYLYKNVEILDKYDVADDEYKKWREKYLKCKYQKHIIKQQVNIRKFNFFAGILSRFGYLYTGIKTRKIDLYQKFLMVVRARMLNVSYDVVDLQNLDYIFFPLQVSNDSQILLNSNVGLFEALAVSIERAKKEQLELIVKLHPAEKNVQVIEKILKLRKRYGFKIVNENTFKVIQYSKYVVTINSTVALESMIIGKHVKILGRTYYKYFNEKRLRSYILRFLVNLDFFSAKPFNREEIKNLLLFKE